MKKLASERRIRHLQREMVRLSMSGDPRRRQLLDRMLQAIAIERRSLVQTRP